ncbi:MAG: hypothetical protein ACODAU_02350 [Myxococcota bacterium]
MSDLLSGIGAAGEAFDPVGEVRPPPACMDPGRPVLAVASAARTVSPMPVAQALVAAMAAEGHAPVALIATRARGRSDVGVLRDGPLVEAGAERVLRVVLQPEDAAAMLERAWAALPPDRPLVATGNDVPALYHLRLGLMVTGGLPPFAWAPSARAVADRMDAEVVEPRAGFVQALIARLAAAGALHPG